MKKLLIADDNMEFLHILSQALSAHFQVYEVVSVAEAQNLLQNIPVDFICSDLHMADGTGFDLFRYVTHNCRDIPFIILTGDDDTKNQALAENCGINYLFKTGSGVVSKIVNLLTKQ